MKTRLDCEKKYVSQLEVLNFEQIKLSRDAAIIGWTRLFVFLCVVFSIYAGFTLSHYLFFGTLFSIVIFLFLVKLHLQKQFEKELGETKIKIIKNEISSLNYEPALWYNGDKYHDASGFSFDLDIFGNYSLFHYSNRCGTIAGEKQLAAHFLNLQLSPQTIRNYQESVREMSEKSNFRLEWQALGLILPDRSEIKNKIKENLSFKNEFSTSFFIKFLLIFGPLQIIASSVYYFISDVYQPLLYSFVLNLMIASFFLKKTNMRQKSVDGLQKIMTAYSRMIDCYLKEKWEKKINHNHAEELQNAKNVFSDLANISEWFDRRMNVVAGILFNGFVLYDLHCVLRLERWKDKNKENCLHWFETIAAIDKMQSLGTFAYNRPHFNYPQTQEGNKISALKLAHPFIPENKNVSNDFSTEHPEKIILITGSNMSGKSTFLRTVGLNLVLAQSGLPVNAAKMEFTPMHLQTSLRQTDNLHENVSLFHAELLRLKSIRDHLKKGELTLVLLDEMLRGTNSEDKLYGSGKLIEELTHENILSLIATHDLELGKLENKYSGIVRNSCFESVITQNELVFDYKLKNGIAKNKNATFLLNKMEIIHDNKMQNIG